MPGYPFSQRKGEDCAGFLDTLEEKEERERQLLLAQKDKEDSASSGLSSSSSDSEEELRPRRFLTRLKTVLNMSCLSVSDEVKGDEVKGLASELLERLAKLQEQCADSLGQMEDMGQTMEKTAVSISGQITEFKTKIVEGLGVDSSLPEGMFDALEALQKELEDPGQKEINVFPPRPALRRKARNVFESKKCRRKIRRQSRKFLSKAITAIPDAYKNEEEEGTLSEGILGRTVSSELDSGSAAGRMQASSWATNRCTTAGNLATSLRSKGNPVAFEEDQPIEPQPPVQHSVSESLPPIVEMVPPVESVEPPAPVLEPLPEREEKAPEEAALCMIPEAAKAKPPTPPSEPSYPPTPEPLWEPDSPPKEAPPPPVKEPVHRLAKHLHTINAVPEWQPPPPPEKPKPKEDRPAYEVARTHFNNRGILADVYDIFEQEVEATIRQHRRGDRGEVDALLHTLHGQSACHRNRVSLEAVCLARVMTNEDRRKPDEPDASSLSLPCMREDVLDSRPKPWRRYWGKFGISESDVDSSLPSLPGQRTSGTTHPDQRGLQQASHHSDRYRQLSDAPRSDASTCLDRKSCAKAQQSFLTEDRSWTWSWTRKLPRHHGPHVMHNPPATRADEASR